MSKLIFRVLIAACGGLSLSGCAHLDVIRLKDNGDNAALVGRIPYSLARTAITVSGTLTLKKCGFVEENDQRKFTLQFEKSLSAATSVEADPEFQYYVDYAAARTWLKEINFSVGSYSNKTLQSFTGTINDQAGAIAIAAATAVITVGATTAIPRVGPARAVDYCDGEVVTARAAIADQSTIIEKAKSEQQKAIANATLSAAQLTATIAVQDQIIAKAQVEMADQTKKHLTRSFTYKWAPERKSIDLTTNLQPFPTIVKEVDLKPIIGKWLTPKGEEWLTTAPHPSDASNPEYVQWLAAQAPVVLAISIARRTIGSAAANQSVEAGSGPTTLNLDSPGGLVIRDPASGVLRVCDGICDSTGDSGEGMVDTTKDLMPRSTVSLSQFGRFLVLPERSELFENATLTVNMNSDGTIANIGHHSLSAAASGLTGISGAATAEAQGIAARNAAIGAQNTATGAQNTAKAFQVQFPDTVNKALADCLASHAAILKAGGQPVPCQ